MCTKDKSYGSVYRWADGIARACGVTTGLIFLQALLPHIILQSAQCWYYATCAVLVSAYNLPAKLVKSASKLPKQDAAVALRSPQTF